MPIEKPIVANNKGKILEGVELETEVSILCAKNMIPPQFATKLIQKLKEKNVKITKDQLNNLFEKIGNILKTTPMKPNGIVTPTLKADQGTIDQKHGNTPGLPENTDMKNLVDSIEQLQNRLNDLEKNRFTWKKESAGKMITTKDIQSLDQETDMEDVLQPLTEIPNDPESIIVVMKWLQHLVDKVGKTYLPDILSYYVDIRWISEDIRFNLIEYSKGIVEEVPQNSPRRDSFNLPTRDHIQSLLFIQKLKGKQIDDRFMNKIDREMEKIAKSLATYPFK